MSSPIRTISFFALSALLFSACNLEQDIDLKLPEYDGQLVVECYLEPGKPFTLLLTESTGFFEPFSTELTQFLNEILVSDAEVQIEHAGQIYVLQPGLFFDPLTQKIANYQHPEIVPENFDEDFKLLVRTASGKTITGQTRILPPVPIDSIVINWDEADTSALILTYLTDDPSQTNYYRRMLHESSLDSAAYQDFVVSDRIVEGDDRLFFGTGYEFGEGDTIINTVYHIDRSYYEFLESVQNAVIAGQSPFGSPGKLITNLEGDAGAVGIFTGLSYDRVVTVIQR